MNACARKDYDIIIIITTTLFKLPKIYKNSLTRLTKRIQDIPWVVHDGRWPERIAGPYGYPAMWESRQENRDALDDHCGPTPVNVKSASQQNHDGHME